MCGLGDLVALASSTLLSQFSPQEYVDELVKCAISKLDPETASKLWSKILVNRVTGSTISQFSKTYSDLVGDTLLPWETSGATYKRGI